MLSVSKFKKGRILKGVIVKTMTLNGKFFPLDEIIPEHWEGVVATLGHPTSNDGYPISAYSQAGKQFIIGKIIKALLKGTGLYVEIEIDKPIKGLSIGDVVECSTGFFHFQDKGINQIIRHVIPDHIAILLNEIGACSIRDGCGLTINSCNCGCKKRVNNMKNESDEKQPEDMINEKEGQSKKELKVEAMNEEPDKSNKEEVSPQLTDIINGLKGIITALSERVSSLEKSLHAKEKAAKENLVNKLATNEAQKKELMALSINTLAVLADKPQLEVNYERGVTHQGRPKLVKKEELDLFVP